MIFLDVGTNIGQTLEEVTKPAYGWSAVHGFEPQPKARKEARRRFPDVNIHPFGLSDRTGPAVLYGDNHLLEASLYPDKEDVDREVVTPCRVKRASDFFDHVPEGDVVMKLNCEGSEVAILTDLAMSGRIHRCRAVMIDFDARRVPQLAAKVDPMIALLRDIGFDRAQYCEDVMIGGTHQDRIANWLGGVLP